MAYDGKSVWRENILDDFKDRLLNFLRGPQQANGSPVSGEEYTWIKMRISHLKAEIERLRNTKNGLLRKLREASGKLTKRSKTASTLELSQQQPKVVNNEADLAKKSYEGDFPWLFLTTTVPENYGSTAFLRISVVPSTESERWKRAYVKSIQRWREKAEFKINKIHDLMDELYREQLFLTQLIETDPQGGGQGTKVGDILNQENALQNLLLYNQIKPSTAPAPNTLRTAGRDKLLNDSEIRSQINRKYGSR